MNEYIKILFIFLSSYFMGSLPTAYIVTKILKGIDIRKQGSGNPGATNVFRIAGVPAGIFTLAIDFLKGFIAVHLVKTFFNGNMNLMVLSGISVIIGHIFTVWLSFKGGKGVATGAGVILSVTPIPALFGMGVFALILILTGYVSLASIISAIAVSSLLWIQTENPLFLKFMISILALLIIIRHRSNINRILSGTEPKVRIKR